MATKQIALLLAAALFVCGCNQPDRTIGGTASQTCEMCGSEWWVTPAAATDVVPPTIEWCFHDGVYCGIGIEFLIQFAKDGKGATDSPAFMAHCLTCTGCRCAAFQPDEWHTANK